MGLLLDGELVAGTGRASGFYALIPVVSARGSTGVSPVCVSFWAFDVLFHDGARLTGASYGDRRAVLETLPLPDPCRVLPRWPATDTADLLAACRALDVEGMVLKRLRSIYRPGERSRHWRKGQGARLGGSARPAPPTPVSRWRHSVAITNREVMAVGQL